MVNYYTVVCECGQPHGVAADQAGERLICSCQREVAIPRMLRNTRELIKSMVADGRLPPNDHCPISGEPADKTMVITVLRNLPQENFISQLLKGSVAGALFAPPATWLGWVQSARESQEPRSDYVGGNILAEAPIRVSEGSTNAIMSASPRQLIRILRTVPIYAYLLDEYPSASISVHAVGHR